MNKFIVCRIACFAAALAIGTALHADEFQYNATIANGDSISAVITASPTSTAGQEDITAITGTVSYLGGTFNIIGLIPDPTYTVMTTADGNFYIDNILYTTGSAAFDYDGIGFTDSNGNTDNIYNNPPEMFYVGQGSGNYPVGEAIATESLTAAPEPATLTLLPGVGALLFLASKLRKRATR